MASRAHEPCGGDQLEESHAHSTSGLDKLDNIALDGQLVVALSCQYIGTAFVQATTLYFKYPC